MDKTTVGFEIGVAIIGTTFIILGDLLINRAKNAPLTNKEFEDFFPGGLPGIILFISGIILSGVSLISSPYFERN
jgi:hypothetical protein